MCQHLLIKLTQNLWFIDVFCQGWYIQDFVEIRLKVGR